MIFFSEGGGTEKNRHSLATAAAVFFEGVPKPRNVETPDALKLAYTTVVLRAEGKPDLEAWEIPCANPRATVALFHGHVAAKSELLPEAQAFHDMHCEVWMLDFYGSGGSGGHATSIGFFEAEDVKRLAEKIRDTAKRPLILYGVSMGGAAITRAVGELGVKPDGIVLVSTYNRLVDTIAHRVTELDAPRWPLSQMLVFWGSVQMGANGFRLNPAEYARNVKCPALVMQGAGDAMVSKDEAKELFDNLAGPKTFAMFEQSGHANLLNSEAKKWRWEISRWLAKLEKMLRCGTLLISKVQDAEKPPEL